MLFISLAVCNISPLIEQVLEKLFENTTTSFYLSMVDNASTDNTVDVIRRVLQGFEHETCKKVQLYRIRNRVNSVDAINQSFAPLFNQWSDVPFTHIVKLDHDYGVPEKWDETITNAFEWRPDLHLLCPSVHESTPKGMQYFSQKIQPEKITNFRNVVFYHYTGIAGYAHSWRYEDFKRLILPDNKVYRSLNAGAVFGSEDADMSLRCKQLWPGDSNAYILNLKGYHWSKPSIGEYEDKWKADATFKRTTLHWEEWMKLNVPKELWND